MMRRKLALAGEEPGDAALADDLMAAMEGADWTLTFRRLATAVDGDDSLLRPLFPDFAAMQAWLPRWRARWRRTHPRRCGRKPRGDPAQPPVEAALEAATEGDMAPFHALLAAVTQPFVEDEGYMLPAPTGFGPYVTFCGT